MKRIIPLVLVMIVTCAWFAHATENPLQGADERGRLPATRPSTAATETTFTYLDISIDSQQAKLAAYQFEFAAETGHVEIVGIEGGEHPAFARTPPFYDPAAIQQHRAIVAAFSTEGVVPMGKTRVARLHLAVFGEVRPQYAVKLQAAASPDGKSIIDNATISVFEGAAR